MSRARPTDLVSGKLVVATSGGKCRLEELERSGNANGVENHTPRPGGHGAHEPHGARDAGPPPLFPSFRGCGWTSTGVCDYRAISARNRGTNRKGAARSGWGAAVHAMTRRGPSGGGHGRGDVALGGGCGGLHNW